MCSKEEIRNENLSSNNYYNTCTVEPPLTDILHNGHLHMTHLTYRMYIHGCTLTHTHPHPLTPSHPHLRQGVDEASLLAAGARIKLSEQRQDVRVHLNQGLGRGGGEEGRREATIKMAMA